MKIKVDKGLCSGHGRCWVVAKEFYELDSNGYNARAGETVNVPTGLEAAARLGADRCPERAITIIED